MEHQRYGKQKSILTRACSKCGGDLGETRYGKQRYCNKCHAEYMRRTRPKHSELNEEQRFKANVRAISKYLKKKGIIEKKPCQVCGSEKSQMHHEDYTKPAEVIWLCREHHLDLHKK